MRDTGRRWISVLLAAALTGPLALPTAAAAQATSAFVDGAEPWTESDCADDVPIVVGSDAAAQSDIYSAITLAGVVGTDCVILAGPRDGDMPAAQQSRLNAATAGGYIVGGTAAVPGTKTAGRDMKRLAGTDRWDTARLVGTEARTISGGTAPSTPSLDTSLAAPDDVSRPGVHLSGAEPWIASDCAGDVPIVVGSDAAAQSDIYSAVTLAGVVGTDCVILAGPRDGDMPLSQQARLDAAASGGYVVGGTAAVPTAKITGRDMTRLAGTNRWATAQLVGRHASGDTTAGTSTSDEAPVPAAEFSAVSAGGSHTCGLRTSGQVECWGNNRHGQADAPDGTFLSVSAGRVFSCGLRTNGLIECWGFSEYGETEAPSGTFTAVSAGWGHSCGLRTDKTIECWGPSEYGDTEAPSGSFTAVSVGVGYSCGLRTDKTIECWGENPENTGDQRNPPSGTFTAVSAGSGYSCGLRTDKTIECWGRILFSHDGEQLNPPSGTFTAVSAGRGYSCGLHTDKTIECWGEVFSEWFVPSGSFTTVSAGSGHVCGLKIGGQVKCWGNNSTGAAASPGPSGVFIDISSNGSYTFFTGFGDAEFGLSCGLRSGGQIECWGGSTTERHYARSPSGAKFTAVSVGRGFDLGSSAWGAHLCGILTSGEVECWAGHNSVRTNTPSGIFTSVSSGIGFACGLRSSGHVACWGLPRAGITAEIPEGKFSALSVSYRHVCGVRTNGTVACWGDNDDGQSDAPAGTFRGVSAGTDFSCGVRTNGTVACWGKNNEGQSDAPEGTFRSVSAGYSHVCGVRTNGTVACWGDSRFGLTASPSGEFTLVSAGIWGSCGLRNNGQIECWGHLLTVHRVI